VQPLVGGAWGAWKVGPSGFVNGLEPSSDLTFTGNWQIVRMKRAYSELPVAASAAGSSASYTFTGRSVAWLTDKSPERGQATVSIDGSVVATVDLQASSKILRVIVFSRSWPTSGQHTIRITVLGTPANRPRVDIDALLIASD
jgi:hypothetical protein